VLRPSFLRDFCLCPPKTIGSGLKRSIWLIYIDSIAVSTLLVHSLLVLLVENLGYPITSRQSCRRSGAIFAVGNFSQRPRDHIMEWQLASVTLPGFVTVGPRGFGRNRPLRPSNHIPRFLCLLYKRIGLVTSVPRLLKVRWEDLPASSLRGAKKVRWPAL
jgi:hypothetical protein